MLVNVLAAGVLFGQSVSAQTSNFLRFACSQLTVERADPLVSPGQNPSPHTHQIIGGNSFNLTVPTIYYEISIVLTLYRWSQEHMILLNCRLARPAPTLRI